MHAYSDDRRKRIVQALRRGVSKSEAARASSISLSSVKRYARMAGKGQPLVSNKHLDAR